MLKRYLKFTVSFKNMSEEENFALDLINDLKRRKVEIKNCGFYKRSNLGDGPIVKALQKSNNYDLNIFFGNKVPLPKAEFDCELVEIEVFVGIPGIYNSDLNFTVSKNSVIVKYGRRMSRKRMEKIRSYLNGLGYRKVRFSKTLF